MVLQRGRRALIMRANPRLHPGMTSCLWGVGSLMVVKELLEDLDPLAKEDFAAFMAKKVLGPLGMNRSTYVAPYPEADLVNTAMGHPWDPRGSFKEYPSQSVAGLWTTAEDLAKGMIVMQKLLAGDPSAPPVLSPDLAKEMFTPQETGTDPCVDKIPHFHAKQGLGYLLEGGNCGVERFWHWGDNPGYKALQVGTLEGGYGAVVLTNSDRGVEITRPVVEKIAALQGWSMTPPVVM